SPRLDIGALFGVDATRVGEYRVHGPTALLQIRHAKARVETAREGEDDGFRGFGADDGELGGHGGFPMDVYIDVYDVAGGVSALRSCNERRHDRLLHVQAVLGLVDGDAGGRVHDRVGGFHVAAERQAVAEHGAVGERHLGLVDDE